MSTATMTAKQVIEDYFKALSGNPKTESLIDQFVDDPNLKQHILDTEAGFPSYQLIAHQIVAEDDLVAVNATVTGTHKGMFAGVEPTGRSISAEAMIFYQVSHGRIVRFWMQVDMMKIMGQLKS